MMALYVASHYKNSPNDLQLMADAPAHQLFVLLGMDQIDLRARQLYMMTLLYSTNLCLYF
jgi:tRNA(Met) C34 N-acetyltransferase TmcA